MNDPINIKIDGHVENGNDTDQISQKEFNSLKSGDKVFLKNGKTGIMKHRLSKSIYLDDKKQTIIYPEDLISKEKAQPKKETLQQAAPAKQKLKTEVKKPVEIPKKTKSRLDLLIEKYPGQKALILEEFKTIGVGYAEIEGACLMAEAAEAAEARQ